MKSVQEKLIQQVSDSLPSQTTIVDAITEVLSISNDSAYRRIRGEITLSLEETLKLSTTYCISIDALANQDLPNVAFEYRSLNSNLSLVTYLKSILGNIEMLHKFEDKTLIYIAKDMPLFRDFSFPNLAKFKMFFWEKTILQNPEYEKQKFEPTLLPVDQYNICREIADGYNHIDSIEVWNRETINSTLSQISFYVECGYFKNKEQYHAILDDLLLLMEKVFVEAENGNKTKGSKNDNFKLYYNQVAIGNDSVHFRMGDRMQTFISHNVLNILSTTNPIFCKETDNVIEKIIKKSTLISSTSPKERIKFFNGLKSKIESTRNELDKAYFE